MRRTKVVLFIAAGVTYAALSASAATAQDVPCTGLLSAKYPTPPAVRALQPEDLVRLRDIGPEHPIGSDHDIFSVSPDGRWLVFDIHRADPAANKYCVGLAVLPISGSKPRITRLLDTGGELIPATFRQYGFAELPSGMPSPASPQWAPNGRWVAFLKREYGSTQVWRANLSEHEGRQITHSQADVDKFRIADDGRTILYAVRPGLVEAAAEIDREGLHGWHFDARAYPVRGARPQIPDNSPEKYLAVDVATGVVRPATQREVARFKPPAQIPIGGTGVSEAFIGYMAWVEPTKAELQPPLEHIAVNLGGNRYVPCTFKTCIIDGPSTTWWSNDGKRLRYTRHEGWAGSLTAIYEWVPGHHAPKRLYRTKDALIECHPIADDVICLRERSRHPRDVVRIDLSSGRVAELFDPNSEFSHLMLGSVQRLHWTSASGIRAYGDLVYPVHYREGRRYPLIVVQYRTRGFLRGGVGDEFPIQAFANRGFFVLSTENPSYEALVGKHATEAETARAFNRSFTGRRRLLESIEEEIRRLIVDGLVDERRVGITGLSDGSSTVQFAALNSGLFSAASATGCCWEPTQDAVIGPVIADHFHKVGWPGIDEPKPKFWSQMSLMRNASRVAFPILFQAADNEYLFALQSYTALKQAGIPVDLYIFPDEDHVKSQPAHRLAIYRRNLDWFDFWLCGRLPRDPPEREEAKGWVKVRNASAARLRHLRQTRAKHSLQ